MKSCLLVDDSRVVRRVARRIFEDLGFSCTEAEDGARAYKACLETLPDLILLDWNMPVMGGYEFLEKLRRMDEGSHPAIIFCTTESDPILIKKAMNAGADEFVMKPFDRHVIKTKLAQMGALP